MRFHNLLQFPSWLYSKTFYGCKLSVSKLFICFRDFFVFPICYLSVANNKKTETGLSVSVKWNTASHKRFFLGQLIFFSVRLSRRSFVLNISRSLELCFVYALQYIFSDVNQPFQNMFQNRKFLKPMKKASYH